MSKVQHPKSKMIKVCGMRDVANIEAIATLPIDYLGFIFYEKSPRFVLDNDIFETAQMPAHINRVAVLVNANLDFILHLYDDFGFRIFQLHGTESPAFCRLLKLEMKNIEIWKAFSVSDDFDFSETEKYEEVVDYFLFDTKTPTQHGGTGQKFDWSVLKKYRGKKKFFLSGGISVNDAEEIKKIKNKKFFGADINSKFEISPALKNFEDVKIFSEKIK